MWGQYTCLSGRVIDVGLYESCELLWKVLRCTDDMVFIGVVGYYIRQVEHITFHANTADVSLPSLYGSQLRYVSFSTGSDESTFACMVLKFSLHAENQFYR